MSGLELCRSIRREYPRHQVYLLVATARHERDDVLKAMAAGADDFLTKPIEEDEFLARIQSAEYALKRMLSQAQLAETDSLTGAFNRRVFEERCVRELQRSTDYSLPLSCIVLDVDLFKHVNDTHGHSIGDMVLVAVADVLRAESRRGDYVCRLGGDEFCILLPQASEEDALTIAERIRLHVGHQRVAASDESVKCHVTLGVAQCMKGITSPSELVDLADQALLAAKQNGRNRTMRFSDVGKGDAFGGSRGDEHVEIGNIVASEIMTTPIVSVTENQSLEDALDLFLRNSIDCAPVVDDRSHLVGLISERDLLKAASSRDQWNAQVRDFMTSNVARFEESTTGSQLLECLQRSPMLRVVIVRDESPIGVVGRSAILRLLYDRDRSG